VVFPFSVAAGAIVIGVVGDKERRLTLNTNVLENVPSTYKKSISSMEFLADDSKKASNECIGVLIF
jgi:hypothetical protein